MTVRYGFLDLRSADFKCNGTSVEEEVEEDCGSASWTWNMLNLCWEPGFDDALKYDVSPELHASTP